jgi:hypothetical protein
VPDNDDVIKPLVAEQATSAADKLREIISELETKEGLAKLSSGDLKFEIKPGMGVMWYVAYGTT